MKPQMRERLTANKEFILPTAHSSVELEDLVPQDVSVDKNLLLLQGK